MTINNITPDTTEFFTLETHPKRLVNSSSLSGFTGSLKVFPRGSVAEKEVQPLSLFLSTSFGDNTDVTQYINNAILSQLSGATNIQNQIDSYLSAVTSQSISARKQQTVEVLRFLPPPEFDDNTLRKSILINNIMPYYRNVYPSYHFAYTNYNSLNFFTGSNLPTDSVMLFPNSSSNTSVGWYAPTGSISFDFWINPRYQGEPNASFRAGTIMHLSSCYAVSLVTGSQKDQNGYPVGFRIMVQLSQSADIPPTNAAPGVYPNDLIFLSNDNSLIYNHWHHITFRWGTNQYNNGTGSFVIDGINSGIFNIPSASLCPFSLTSSDGQPDMLCVGNYYEGKNTGFDSQALFFTDAVSTSDGVMSLAPGEIEFSPGVFNFSHPLNAEVHELKVYSKYLNDIDLSILNSNGPQDLSYLLFYLPPFFTAESPFRAFSSDLGFGGVLISPFQQIDATTDQPYGVEMAYGIDGHYINLENFTKDFAQGVFPRLWNLTGSVIDGNQSTPQSANQYLYNTGSNVKRLWTILPNDNGLFYPNYNFLSGGSPLYDINTEILSITGSTDRYQNDLGSPDYGSILLRNMISTASIQGALTSGSTNLNGSPTPEQIGGEFSDDGTYTVLQRTMDNTSNQITFFDISNLYYGNKIKETSLILTDTSMTGTNGKISITLADDGNGNVYRANCFTSQSTWNSVGNIFYNEGLVMIKSPHLFFFGTDQWNLSFQGVQNIHTLTFNCMARPSQITSSSNPSYLPVSASTNANDTDQRFVLIDELLIHDQDLNVIGRTKLVQPIVKRTGDKILFKYKIDY